MTQLIEAYVASPNDRFVSYKFGDMKPYEAEKKTHLIKLTNNSYQELVKNLVA